MNREPNLENMVNFLYENRLKTIPTDVKGGLHMKMHFSPMVHFCEFCQMDFDVVSKNSMN